MYAIVLLFVPLNHLTANNDKRVDSIWRSMIVNFIFGQTTWRKKQTHNYPGKLSTIYVTIHYVIILVSHTVFSHAFPLVPHTCSTLTRAEKNPYNLETSHYTTTIASGHQTRGGGGEGGGGGRRRRRRRRNLNHNLDLDMNYTLLRYVVHPHWILISYCKQTNKQKQWS